MYIKDTHIGFYIIAAILGLVIGQFIDWMNKRLPENEKVFTLDIFRKYKIEFNPNYILMLVTSAIYIGLVYRFGIQDNFIGNLNLIKYLILTPMLLSAFVIDYKLHIIPNRLNLTMFEIGIIIAFLYGISNVAITVELLLGMIAGGGIFLIIALLGGMIYGKDAIGMGDVKIMTALGLYVGLTNITIIAIVGFLIGAIVGIVLIISKVKKTNEYIPFGPFITIATFINIFVPFEILLNILKIILSFGFYKV